MFKEFLLVFSLKNLTAIILLNRQYIITNFFFLSSVEQKKACGFVTMNWWQNLDFPVNHF